MHTPPNKPTPRRQRIQRQLWERAVQDEEADGRTDPDFIFDRPYLLAHPEREIAAAGTHIGVVYCAACDITYKAPWADVDGVGRRMAAALRFVERHNALIHPRRAARLTK